MKLKLLAIGGLGNMLGPSAKHLTGSDAAYIRVLDRGAAGQQKDNFRQAWRQHGAELVPTLIDLVADGDFDGMVICAGKNGDDYHIFRELIPLLNKHRSYFILHLSTVSCSFVQATHAYCAQHSIQYVNYPLTGGAKGAANATMLVLCGGDKALYEKVAPMLHGIGVPKYFGEKIDLATGIKLIGHILVFHGFLGVALAIPVQKSLFGLSELTTQQADFFDFLNQGAGGTKQWDLVMRQGILENNWDQGFLIQHAVIDALYTAQLIQQHGLPTTLILPLLEVVLLFAYILNHHPEQGLATQTVLRLLTTVNRETLDSYIKEHLCLDIVRCLENCIAALPKPIQQTLMLDVFYPC
jgi:3-hydroxyisobutyrate dehydrogenase-like beta-hydroxyacid dehydrogenase